MSVYPDNPNRESRVKQLITQTSTLQSSFVDVEKQLKKITDDTEQVVNEMSHRAGYPSVEQYIQASKNALTPAQKANYQAMCDSLVANNSPLKNSQLMFGAVGAIGFIMKMGVPKIVSIYCKFSGFVHGMYGILRGLVLMFKGAFHDGWTMIRTFATLIKGNYSRAIHVGEDITTKTASSLRWLNRAGKVLQWAGIFAEIGMFIYTVVQGAADKEKLQAAIIECCCTRFGVKKIQLLMNQTLTWTSKVAGIVTSMNFLQKKMEKQKQNPPAKASMVITEDDIAEEMRTGVDELLTKFDDELGHCNPDEVVFGELALLDDDKSSGEKAWTVEDPSLKEMKEWIDKHPLKDDKGNPIPIEGPAFKDIGLKWANFKVTAAKESSQAKFVGENNSDKGQRFKAIHISFPVGDAAPTALFTGKNFIQKGNTTGNDVSVEISGVGGVTGLGQDFTPQFKEEDNCIKINILPAAGAECITLPSKASINVLFTGKTGNAGSTACLVREEWFPFGDKSWEDVIVDKA
ncbi:hypothetical protein FPSE5266_10081 [Fusarium pseudograminearum]|nr:hypothetical protein FPSE5266_10081 [Fusarium pseudograminearum]